MQGERVQDQRDEVEALQAIFPGEVQVVGDGVAKCFEIRAAVHVERQERLVVWACAAQSAQKQEGEGEAEAAKEEEGAVESRLSGEEGWACPDCTFVNPLDTFTCEMCNHKREVVNEAPPPREMTQSKMAEREAVARVEEMERQRQTERDEHGFVRPAVLVRVDADTLRYNDIALQFLPPVELHARLPAEYPDVPPEFSVSCFWLSECHLRAMSEQLRQAWESQQGLPVVFVWMDVIANCAKDILAASGGRLEISPEEGDAESCLLYLVRFDRMRVVEATRQKEFACPICLEEVEGAQACFLGGCEHVCCRPCLQGMCQFHISQGSVNELVCPAEGCGNRFAPHVVRDAVQGIEGAEEDDLFGRFRHLLVQRALESISGVCYCPRCDRNGAVTAVMPLVDAPDLCVCPSCRFSFCARCRCAYHPASACRTAAERMQLAQEAQELKDGARSPKKPRDKGDKGAEDDEERKRERARAARQRLRERDRRQQELSVSLIHTITVNCPSCTRPVQKSEGCNKMQCLCQTLFCYKCGEVIQGYDHFWNNKCKIFADEDVKALREARENQIAREVVALEAEFQDLNPEPPAQRNQGAPPPQRVEQQTTWKCPGCSASNLRVGNNGNYANCCKCGKRFCFLCQTLLRKGARCKGHK